MIAEDGIAPDAVLQPKGAVEQRIILLRGAEFEPNAPQAVQRLEGGRGHMTDVIPDQAASHRRYVSNQGCAENGRKTRD